MLTLQFYTRKDCSLCQSALAVVSRVRQRVPFELTVVDIDSDAGLSERFGAVIPVITCGTIELARSFVDEKNLKTALEKLGLPAQKSSVPQPADHPPKA